MQGVMIGGRGPSVEDDLQWKMTFIRRLPMVEDELWWKTTSVEGNLWWKMTFSGRRWKIVNVHCYIYLEDGKL